MENHITSLQDGQWNKVKWGTGLEQIIEGYFNQLFTATSTEWSQVTNCVQWKITRIQNKLLLANMEEKEVNMALFSMHPDKSSGPDGMSSSFYQKCWAIVKSDKISAM